MVRQIGQANSFHAIRLQRFVGIVAVGKAPTSGWIHSWRPGVIPNNQVWFLQTPPIGPVLQVITPFVSHAIMEIDFSYAHVEVFHASGNPESIDIVDFDQADPILAAFIQKQLPPRVYLPEQAELENTLYPVIVYKTNEPFITFSGRIAKGRGFTALALEKAIFAPTAQYYERVLGTWESPEICKCDFKWPDIVCTNPHYTATLKIRIGSDQDVAGAVSDCLRDAAIGAAVAGVVATVLTGGAGFAAAKAVFMPLFTGCLSGKLKDILSVDLTLDRDCR